MEHGEEAGLLQLRLPLSLPSSVGEHFLPPRMSPLQLLLLPSPDVQQPSRTFREPAEVLGLEKSGDAQAWLVREELQEGDLGIRLTCVMCVERRAQGLVQSTAVQVEGRVYGEFAMSAGCLGLRGLRPRSV